MGGWIDFAVSFITSCGPAQPRVVRAPIQTSLVDALMSIGLEIQPGGCTRPKGPKPEATGDRGLSERISTHELVAWALAGAVVGLLCLAVGSHIAALLAFVVGVIVGIVVVLQRTANAVKVIGLVTALGCSFGIWSVVGGWFAK